MTADTRLHDAITALKANDSLRARQLLQAVLHGDPQNAEAWFLLSFAFTELHRQTQCLDRAIAIDPGHQQARQRLAGIKSLQYSHSLDAQLADAHVHDTNDIGGNRPLSQNPDDTARLQPLSAGLSSRHLAGIPTWLIAAGVIMVIFFLCGGLLMLRMVWGNLTQQVLDAESQPPAATEVVEIPPTFTPVASSGSVIQGNSCPAAERYLENVSDAIFAFSIYVKAFYASNDGNEMVGIALAMEEPYDEFNSYSVPACAAGAAQKIRSGMEEIIGTVIQYAIGTIETSQEATAATHAGVEKMLAGFDELTLLSGSSLDMPTTEPPVLIITTSVVPTHEPTISVLPAGSSLVVDKNSSRWEIQVTSIEYRDVLNTEINGELISQRLPVHRFVVLFLTGINLGQQTDYLFPIGLVIRDSAGNEYDLDNVATEVAESFVYNVELGANQAHPGAQAQAIAVFDVPYGVGPYSLHSTWNEFFGDGPDVGLLVNIAD